MGYPQVGKLSGDGQQQPTLTINLPERAYSADVDYPVAVVTTASRHLIVYQLEGTPSEYKRVESPLKYQHRCVSIFKDKKGMPTGFALGSIEGRVAIQYINATPNSKVIGIENIVSICGCVVCGFYLVESVLD